MLSLRFLPLLCFFLSYLSAERIQTFYGPFDIEEQVLLDLIHSPPFERLKEIHQYGVAYYTKAYPEEYTRYDHSLGVFALLRAKGASLDEQIAGLLHDISHTVFSHVGDWVFSKAHQEDDYQTSIHDVYLVQSGIEKILKRHGYSVSQVSPKREGFIMLEQPLPDLCADRIDYNIQGAYFRQFITKEEAQKLFCDLTFSDGKWTLSDKALATKLVDFSLFMTEHCWGSAENHVTSQWLAEALLRGIEAQEISWKELHSGVDQEIWERLEKSKDSQIQKKMQMLKCADRHYRLVPRDQAQSLIPFKCRGIDPWIKEGGTLARLTSLDKKVAENLHRVKKLAQEGWPIEIIPAQFSPP